jgi:hypothetical protein
MNIPTIKDCVLDGKKVTFVRYQGGQPLAGGELWYRCENGFEFPVPACDTGGAIFLAEDKALLFMRWIRKHIALLQGAEAEHSEVRGLAPWH